MRLGRGKRMGRHDVGAVWDVRDVRDVNLVRYPVTRRKLGFVANLHFFLSVYI